MSQTVATARQHVWEELLDEELRAIAGHYARTPNLGRRPALLSIDNYNAAFGDRREPLLESIKRFPSSCGEAAWDAIEPTQRLMRAARAAGIPVIHTTRDFHNQTASNPVEATRRQVSGADQSWQFSFFAPLAPEPEDLIIYKTRASGFYGTPLGANLVQRGVDTLILCGESTSGCVRATCLEAQMHGYRVAVVEECVFDRNRLSHKVNLFDMHLKYADVLFLDDVLAYLADLPADAR